MKDGHVRSLVAAVTIAGTLVVVTAANASTVSVTENEGSLFVEFHAGPGEVNDVELSSVQGGQSLFIDVVDHGAGLAAGPGCHAIDPNSVSCEAPPLRLITRARFDLGDGNDRLTARASIAVTAWGGSGDDALIGGDWSDKLRGGPGEDVLRGRSGDDSLKGDDADGLPQPDRIAGGRGKADLVDYSDRPHRVSVDVTRRDGNGADGEGDVMTGVEHVRGGAGDDVLAGNDLPNELYGGAGNDRLIGRGGNDKLVRGGARTSCGNGDDAVTSYRIELQVLDADCEWIWTPASTRLHSAVPALVRPSWIGWRVPCRGFEPLRCGTRMRIAEPSGARRVLGRGRRDADAGPGRMLRVRLTPLGRRIVAPGVLVGVKIRRLRWSVRLPG